MVNEKHLPLTVFKASAGSGKTFRLAVEYIKLLIVNPMSYRTILAVTFTNKATEEMKMRILSQLYGIWKQLPSSERYMEKVVEELGISRETASKQSGAALAMLIHNYHYFRVETIDSFFQSVLRNLARELDLTANLRIELNDGQVEEQAVDMLIESLTPNDQMLQWIMSYIAENISDDKNWNVIYLIKSFGKTIFRDYYKEGSEQLNHQLAQPHFFENFTRQLREQRQNALNKMQGFADEFFRQMDAHGITPDMLAGKKNGISSYFNKLRGTDWSDKKCLTANLAKSLESAENWVTKTNRDRATVIPVVEEVLLPVLRQAESERLKQWRLYVNAELTLRHLNQLRLLGTIEQKVRQLNADANRFLLSDTQQLLHQLMGDSDSPFVFEKMGTQLEHIMIDEFQDTSTVQWKNFKRLLHETMSHGYHPTPGISRNLIVGDVKQSIYRWRSGDWRLLNNIDGQFANASELVFHDKLDENHRSASNIVTFNNLFFQEAAQQEYVSEQTVNGDDALQIKNAYSDVKQIVSDHSPQGGLVSISLLDNEDYQEHTLQLMADTIKKMLSQGIPMSKMAILVRANRHIPLIADYFMQNLPDVKLVSDEAFRLESSVGVSMMVMALRLLVNPGDMLTKASLVKSYQRDVLGNLISDSTLFEDLESLNSKLPEAFTNGFGQWLTLPLYELCELLYEQFELSSLSSESAYVCTFFDVVSEFARENTADIESFLAEWDEDFHKQNIQSDEIDGIRIVSIHRSKGLEFDHVLIPFCDWKLEMGDTLWCVPKEAPYNQLPLVPVDYGMRLLDSIYEAYYREEHLQNTVDNLNLLYVAFTRAKLNLFVWGRAKASGSRSAILQSVLPQLPKELPDATVSEAEHVPMIFEYGQMLIGEKQMHKEVGSGKSENGKEPLGNEEENVFLTPVTTERISINTYPNKAEFRQSNKSRDFVTSTGEETDQQQTYIKIGNVLHNLFSTIRTTADIDGMLRQLEFDGILYDDNISPHRIRQLLDKGLSHPQVAEWFDDRWTLFNECTILSTDPETGATVERRPDRVMTDGEQMVVVDFKFGKPNRDYNDQVRLYMQLLTNMGYSNIKGYLWYVYSNKVEEVK